MRHGSNLRLGRILRRHRHHHRRQGSGSLEHQREIGVRHRPDQCRIMGALAAQRQMRSFEMQTEKTGDGALCGQLASLDGGPAMLLNPDPAVPGTRVR